MFRCCSVCVCRFGVGVSGDGGVHSETTTTMAEFVNYKVVLHLKDGTQTQGTISHVDGALITLGSKTIENALVKDLKVVQLPKDVVKKKRVERVEDSRPSTRSGTPRQGDWASVQEIKLKEFDFAANLAMFDKKSVFADFEKNDPVAAQDRLVGHNKVDAVKRSGDKYGNTEMVLPDKTDNWNSIASLSGRRALPVPVGGAVPHPAGRDQHAFQFEDRSAAPVASPVQLLEIERAAQESFGVDAGVSAEIAAANTFQLVVREMLGGAARLSRKNHNLPPLVLLLVGSGRASSRAFALGRHLTNHGVRVLAYLIEAEIAEADMLHQCRMFEKAGGKVVSVPFGELLDILHHQLETPVELIVDALQGYDSHLADLFYTEQAMLSLQQVVRWANEPRQSSKVLSLDMIAGVDGGSGAVLDPTLRLHARYVVSVGLPVTGLVYAYNNGVLAGDVVHYVVDAGIPNAVYSTKPHLRKFDKFWYCADGYVKLVVAAVG